MATQISSAAVTHVGVRRDSNEDAFCHRPDLGLFVVADGMGGHEAGEVASRVAVDVIESFINDTRDADLNHTWPFPFDTTHTLEANRLIAAFRLANRRVGAAIADNAAYKGMATTAAAALVRPNGRAHIAHVGDSRVYLLRDQQLQQLTDDHSWVGEQVRAGLLTDRDAHSHPWRNVVTRAITGAEDPEVDVTEVTLQVGDLLLLCSDGLSAVVEQPQLEALLTRAMSASPNLDALASELITAANDGGGPDNTTIVLVQMHDR